MHSSHGVPVLPESRTASPGSACNGVVGIHVTAGHPRSKPWDIAIAVTAVILALLVAAMFGIMELFLLAFTDYCPPERCSADNAGTAVVFSVFASAVVWLIGTIITVVQLVRRKAAWPFATATLALCIVAGGAGVVGYFMAVGYDAAHPADCVRVKNPPSAPRNGRKRNMNASGAHAGIATVSRGGIHARLIHRPTIRVVTSAQCTAETVADRSGDGCSRRVCVRTRRRHRADELWSAPSTEQSAPRGCRTCCRKRSRSASVDQLGSGGLSSSRAAAIRI